MQSTCKKRTPAVYLDKTHKNLIGAERLVGNIDIKWPTPAFHYAIIVCIKDKTPATKWQKDGHVYAQMKRR